MLLRHSIFADERRPREYAWSAPADDCLRSSSGQVIERQKAGRPRVGFRGFVGSGWQRLVYRMMGRGRKAEGLEFRARMLRNLQRSSRVETAFTPLKQFSMGAKGIMHQDAERADRTWLDYVAALQGSDYTLCLRGAGNFSYRFYEDALGWAYSRVCEHRCVLPFDGQIPWREHCVWVEESEVDQIADRVADFHEQISAADFVALQHANRKLWREWLAPLGFWRQMMQQALTIKMSD